MSDDLQRLYAAKIRRARARQRALAARPQPALITPREFDRLDVEDAKLRRCRNCGEWAYGQQACTVCRVPAGLVRDTA